MCVQHVRHLLNRVTLSVSPNIFQLSVKRCWCFYNLCLGFYKGGNTGIEIPSALPAAYFPFLVRVLHLMSLPQSSYINCISIIFLSASHVCHILGEDNNTYLLSTFKPILRYIKCLKYYNELDGSKF